MMMMMMMNMVTRSSEFFTFVVSSFYHLFSFPVCFHFTIQFFICVIEFRLFFRFFLNFFVFLHHLRLLFFFHFWCCFKSDGSNLLINHLPNFVFIPCIQKHWADASFATLKTQTVSIPLIVHFTGTLAVRRLILFSWLGYVSSQMFWRTLLRHETCVNCKFEPTELYGRPI